MRDSRFNICCKLLSVLKYDVQVVTGDVWNAGTDANVYMTIYGQYGDTGVRQLFKAKNAKKFRMGQVENSCHVSNVHVCYAVSISGSVIQNKLLTASVNSSKRC